jgi:hypothetical protein
MKQNSYDGNMYYIHQKGETLILMIYVDDLFITGSSPSLIQWLKNFLHQKFEMKDLGHIKKYLGISFEQVPKSIFLYQKDYATSILRDFGIQDCKASPIPLPEGLVLVKDTHSPPINSSYYCKLVGKLTFLTITRIDLAYVVSRVSNFMAKPQQAHLDATLHILRYIKGTLDHGILYKARVPIKVSRFTDVDWGSYPDTRRSIGAYVFILVGGLISWQSKKQLTVFRSSTESEYHALSDGAQEANWLHQLLTEFQVVHTPLSFALSHSFSSLNHSPPSFSITLFCDNQGDMKLSHNPIFHLRSKHIEIHYHFIRERILTGEIRLENIRTHDQPPDALTKPLEKLKFMRHRNTLGIQSLLDLSLKKTSV